ASSRTGTSHPVTHAPMRMAMRSNFLLEEASERLIRRGFGFGVFEERVHLPRHAVGVAHPELVRLRVATRRALLLEEVDALALLARRLGRDVARPRVADPEVAHRARLPARVERKNHGRVRDLELRVVVAHLRRL